MSLTTTLQGKVSPNPVLGEPLPEALPSNAIHCSVHPVFSTGLQSLSLNCIMFLITSAVQDNFPNSSSLQSRRVEEHLSSPPLFRIPSRTASVCRVGKHL
eukprot:5231619-Amphidinium_carterae.1